MHCLIVENHPVTLFGLEVLIKKQFPDWKLTSATTYHAAMELINGSRGQQIDLVLVGLLLPDGNGLSIIQHLRKSAATEFPKCIAMSMINGAETASRCKAAGAIAFVSKDNSLTEILHVIYATVNPSQREAFMPKMEAHGRWADRSVRLTARQKDIVQLVMEGYSNKRIANTLNLSYGTVKNYMFDLMRIFGVNSRLELAIRCQENAHLLHLGTRTIQPNTSYEFVKRNCSPRSGSPQGRSHAISVMREHGLHDEVQDSLGKLPPPSTGNAPSLCNLLEILQEESTPVA